MSYYLISRTPVFLTHERYRALNMDALREKTPKFRVAAAIAGTPESAEADALRYAALLAKQEEDPVVFQRQWVEFDLRGDEAHTNVWDLLYDYCHYYGTGRLIDQRDELERIMSDYLDDGYTYPMGRIFAFEHLVYREKWWCLRSAKAKRAVRIIISAGTVERLVGTLSSFRVVMPGFELRCAKDCEIVPATHQTPIP